jgi:hypothetical protein
MGAGGRGSKPAKWRVTGTWGGVAATPLPFSLYRYTGALDASRRRRGSLTPPAGRPMVAGRPEASKNIW